MLVEDNPADSMLVRKAFEEHGFAGEITVVEDGETAIHLIQALDQEGLADCPDLVIIDLSLPRKSGHDAWKRCGAAKNAGTFPW